VIAETELLAKSKGIARRNPFLTIQRAPGYGVFSGAQLEG